MSHSFKKVWNVVSTVLVVLVVLLAVALVGVRLVGLNTYVVLSGSMEPTYHTGSLLYVKSVDPQDLRVGDPITFMLNEDTVATHRIIEILPDEEDSSVLRFRTQGDANDAPAKIVKSIAKKVEKNQSRFSARLAIYRLNRSAAVS